MIGAAHRMIGASHDRVIEKSKKVAARLQAGGAVLLDLSNAALRLLLAPQCAACAAPLDCPLAGPVCAACWRGVAWLTPPCCAVCGDVLQSLSGNTGPGAGEEESCVRCRQQRPAFALARSAGRYEGALRQIIHAFKYQHRRTLGEPLAGLLKEVGRPLLDEACRCRCIPGGRFVEGSIRPMTSRRTWGCLCFGCFGAAATVRPRRVCPPAAGTPTCARSMRCAGGARPRACGAACSCWWTM
jgi:hypothetical protein